MINETPWYKDGSQLFGELKILKRKEKKKPREVGADIIRNEKGKFITVYMPNVPGSLKQACEDLRIAEQNGWINNTSPLIKIIESRQIGYDAGKTPPTIKDFNKYIRESNF